MSEQTRHDDRADARLSEAYRDLSDETTSAALDRKILDLAEAGASGPSRSLSRLLAIKPLAWAATVLLTVTLVLHLQQETPGPDSLLYEEDVMNDTVPLPAEPERAMHKAAKPVVLPAGANRQDEAAATPPTAAARDADSNAGNELQSFAPAAETRAKMQEVEEFVAERERSISTIADTAEPTLSVQGRRSLAAPEPRYCSDAETADASSWYRCILNLTEEGKLDEAAAERTRLFSAFPDFEVR